MIPSRAPAHCYRLVFWCAILLACLTGEAYARDFTVRTLSEPGQDARYPSVGPSGLVAWQSYSERANAPVPGMRQSDIIVYRNGSITNITERDPRLGGRNERPRVVGDQVLFNARFTIEADGGWPFDLAIPLKTDEMRRIEEDYPTLFDPPTGALEAKDTNGQEGDSPDTMVEFESKEDDQADDSSLQHQMWRGSGRYFDIAVYRANGLIERITPGTRHFSTPVMSEAGMAFQVARGWPYGYDILTWKPDQTELIQITTNYFYTLNPDIHGNDLVFQAWDGTDYEIFHYRFDTDELRQITNNQFDDTHPVTWNGEIAWIAHPTVNAEIFHYRDGEIRKISDVSQENSNPSIWQGRVVWQGYDDTDLEIYYFDGRRTIKLTSNIWDDAEPQICDGIITWMSYVDNSDSEIMVLDLSDNVTVQLTDNDWEDMGPRTAGERVVWHTLTPDGTAVEMAEPVSPRETAVP
jgi:hypothetical protein